MSKRDRITFIGYKGLNKTGNKGKTWEAVPARFSKTDVSYILRFSKTDVSYILHYDLFPSIEAAKFAGATKCRPQYTRGG